ILYTDRLIGLSEWPNAKASYIYGTVSDQAAITLNFALNTASYESGADPRQVERALALYQKVYFQLHQDYTANTSVKVPGVKGNAVAMRLCNSLFGKAGVALDETQAEVIRTFVADCVIYLQSVL